MYHRRQTSYVGLCYRWEQLLTSFLLPLQQKDLCSLSWETWNTGTVSKRGGRRGERISGPCPGFPDPPGPAL